MVFFICSRSNRYFIASTKSGLAPGPTSLRITRSEYWPDCVAKIAKPGVPFTRSTERGLTEPTRSMPPDSSALTRALSSPMPTNSISSR